MQQSFTPIFKLITKNWQKWSFFFIFFWYLRGGGKGWCPKLPKYSSLLARRHNCLSVTQLFTWDYASVNFLGGTVKEPGWVNNKQSTAFVAVFQRLLLSTSFCRNCWPKYSRKFVTFLTYFSQMLHFLTSWKCQKIKGFLTFSGGIGMEYCMKIG